MATMFRVTGWIIAVAPLAIFAIMAWLFATQGLATIAALAKLIGLMYLGLIVMVLVFWVVLLLLRENPIAITRHVMEPVILAFTTRSSEVTLPVHMETLERMGVPNKVVAIVLPLGYSFNLDGSTLYIALAVTFLAEAYHLQLTWSAELTIIVTAMIASKGIANVPSGGLVALATVLTAVGLPVEAIADHRRRRCVHGHGPHRGERVRQHGRGEAGAEAWRQRLAETTTQSGGCTGKRRSPVDLQNSPSPCGRGSGEGCVQHEPRATHPSPQPWSASRPKPSREGENLCRLHRRPAALLVRAIPEQPFVLRGADERRQHARLTVAGVAAAAARSVMPMTVRTASPKPSSA